MTIFQPLSLKLFSGTELYGSFRTICRTVGATPLGTAQGLTDLSTFYNYHKLSWCTGITASVLSNLYVAPLQCCTLYFACQQLTNITHHHLSRCPFALPGRKLKNLLSIRQMGFLFSYFIPTCVWKLWHDTLFPHEHQASFHLGLFTLSLERERFPWPTPSRSLCLPLTDIDPVEKYTEDSLSSETLTFTHIHLHRVKNMHLLFCCT